MPAIRIEIQGQSFDAPLPEAPVQIGKAEDADLRIQGDGVARQHCVLEPLGGGRTKLKDLGSGQDTLVNGVAIKQISLNDGDVIEVGSARITYSAHAAGAPPPAAKVPPVAVLPATPPQPASVAPKGAVSADVSAPPAAPSERAAPAATQPSQRPGKKSRVPLVGALVGVLVLGAVVFLMQGMEQGADANAARSLREGRELFAAKDYEAARRTFRRAHESAPKGDVLRGEASDGLALVGDIEREMEARLERLQSEGLVLTEQALGAARARFLEAYGRLEAPRFDRAKGAILRAQSQWESENLEATQQVATDCTDNAQFARARAAWQGLAAKAPSAVDVREAVAAAIAALGPVVEAKADELLARAAAWNKGGMPYRSVTLFDDMLPRFAGFPAADRLEAARTEARTLNSVPVAARPRSVQGGPTHGGPTHGGPTAGKRAPGGPQPGPQPSGPTDPTQAAAEKARADALITQAATEADARRFREGAALLAAGARTFQAGPQHTRLLGLAEDYGLAAQGKSLLIAHIKAEPARYANVRIASRLKVALFDADAQYLHARVSGGRSKHAWARLPASVWPGFIKRLAPGQKTALPAAALLHAVGQREAAEATLVVATEKGVPTDRVFVILARWRGMEVPEGGFVTHAGRYVTPAERDTLVREEQIAAALTMLDSRRPGERKAAVDALLSLGEAAAPRLSAALTARRAYLADELLRSKSFTSGKYKNKLLQLLAEHRKYALALIYDAKAYPYPVKSAKAQADVEARVDKVREVWERPFDLVAQWDTKLRERLAGITEVDEFLARVDPSFEPDLEAIKERINKAIDVPSSADPGRREYSLRVIVYNTTLATTATGEEKANVRSVNNYRMMMGLLAVKIDEKLTRAARGHSRHMATNKYFAHNVPAPYGDATNRSPGIRAKQQGFGGGVGENIARGPGTGHGAFMAWFRSSGHHRNMLGRGWMVMGCGRAAGTWWTQLFAGGSKSLKAPDPLPAPAKAFAPDPEGAGGGAAPEGGAEETDGGS